MSGKVRNVDFSHVNPAMSMDSFSTVGDVAPTYNHDWTLAIATLVGRGYIPDGHRRILLRRIVRVP